MSSPVPDPASTTPSPTPANTGTPAPAASGPTSAPSGPTSASTAPASGTGQKSPRPAWVLPTAIGCGVVLLIVLFIAFLGIVSLVLRGPSPSSVAEDFTVGTLEGDCKKVMENATPELRSDVDCSDISESAAESKVDDVSFKEVSSTDNDYTATVVADVSYTAEDGPDTMRLKIELQKVDHDWKVADVDRQ